jgi:Fe2+ transport system protein FeoA
LNDFYDENDKTQEKKDGMTNKKFTMLSECGKSGFWRISNLKCRGETRKRFLAMGLTKGALIEIVKVAPLGDPIDIKVKGYHLSLRKDEAAKIEVETIESENKDPDGEK